MSNNSPVKKNYEFYKNTGNLWESRYLASAKIAKYYHIPHESYMSGPNSPLTLSISADYLNKATTHVKQSKGRLRQRQTERIYIQTLSKQLSNEKLLKDKCLPRPNPKPQVSLNLWENLKEIPICKLKHIFPEEIRQKDLEGLNNILAKNQLEKKQQELLDDQKQVNKLKERLFTIQRHAYYTKLEQRCGIEKVRNDKIEQGIYGYIKVHKVSPRLVLLSMPHRSRSDDMEKSDYKGLIYKERPEIMTKMKELKGVNRVRKSRNGEFIKETIQSISEFEKKLAVSVKLLDSK